MTRKLKTRQIDRVLWAVTVNPRLILRAWLSLPEIQRHIKTHFDVLDMETAISARLRDLRKAGYVVERRRRDGRALREYRVTSRAHESAPTPPRRIPGRGALPRPAAPAKATLF